jgi:hypothetical protein
MFSSKPITPLMVELLQLANDRKMHIIFLNPNNSKDVNNLHCHEKNHVVCLYYMSI